MLWVVEPSEATSDAVGNTTTCFCLINRKCACHDGACKGYVEPPPV